MTDEKTRPDPEVELRRDLIELRSLATQMSRSLERMDELLARADGLVDGAMVDERRRALMGRAPV